MRRSKKELQEEAIKYRVFQENGKWFGYRICPKCKEEIKYSSIKSFILLRTLRNSEKQKTLCTSCGRKGVLNSFFNKTHSKISKKQISISRKGKACGEKNSMSNPEYRNRVSIALKEKYASGDLDFLKEIQRNNAFKNQANGKLNTAPISEAEKELRKALENAGYEIEPQFKIGSLRYDLFIKEKNVLIEYNGDYWHCNPKKYNSNYFNKKKGMFAWQLWEKDLIKKEIAEKNGHKHFTIWETDYKFNKETEINKIIDKL